MKIKSVLILAVFCILLSSCTVQTQFDVFDFCERYNKLYGEKALSTNDFLSDNDGNLYCFLKTGESTVLITLSENENTSLDGIFVTVERGQYNEKDIEAVINTVCLAFGAFNYADADKAKEYLSSVGFDGNYKPFYDGYGSEKDGKYKITLYSNEFAFTVSQEKIDAD